MDRSALEALLSPDGTRLVEELGQIASTADAASAITRLRRAGHAPEAVAAVVEQARLRERARAKFGDDASRMLFTRAGLEQATRLTVALRHAERLSAAGLRRVADLGCGIGGDALGFATCGLDVLAVDADEVTAAIAAHNLADFGDRVAVRHARAEDVDLAGVEAVWLDPARRTAGHSETARVRAADYSPPLPWAFALASRLPAGIKLGPGFDRTRIPDGVEAQWIGVGGATVELVLWSGALARPGVGRAALLVRGEVAHELTAATDTADEPVRALGAYVHEPAGAVIRARLIGEVARRIGAGMLAPNIAYLTSDAPAETPFVSTFRVREQLPNDIGRLSRALRERGIGTLEIKKRGVDVDPAVLRPRLKLRGPESATLILTRVGERRLTLLVERV
ncbi:THUMP-like domain-containing protein [Microbacterium sp.]|uniref:THUMP-like domain-containing protein n=1 Tax=Microbacterium sp. TaxID=51671 RepID=UPI0039E46E6E